MDELERVEKQFCSLYFRYHAILMIALHRIKGQYENAHGRKSSASFIHELIKKVSQLGWFTLCIRGKHY